MKKAKFIIFATVFIDVVGIGIIIPSLPIFLNNITKNSFEIGAILAIYSICGFLFSPLLGALSDKYGRRPVLIFSLIGTALSWFVFSVGSLATVVIGRLIGGITSGNISAAQGFITDISENEKERMHNYGLLGAIFGIAFVIGPALGAALSNFSITMPFLVTGFLAAFNSIAAYFFLPETNLNKDHHKPLSINPLNGIKKCFSTSPMNILLTIWFLYALAISNFHALFALYSHLAYGFDATKNGFVMTFVGLIMAINQGVLLKFFWLKHWSQSKIQIIANVQMIAALILMIIGDLRLMILGILVQSIAQPLLRVTSNSEIVGAASKAEQGQVLGVFNSLFFLASIITPIIGGALLDINLQYPWILASVYMIAACALLLSHYKNISRLKTNIADVAPMSETELK